MLTRSPLPELLFFPQAQKFRRPDSVAEPHHWQSKRRAYLRHSFRAEAVETDPGYHASRLLEAIDLSNGSPLHVVQIGVPNDDDGQPFEHPGFGLRVPLLEKKTVVKRALAHCLAPARRSHTDGLGYRFFQQQRGQLVQIASVERTNKLINEFIEGFRITVAAGARGLRSLSGQLLAAAVQSCLNRANGCLQNLGNLIEPEVKN